jgi:AraC-type DNA-binding domain-containing proteins
MICELIINQQVLAKNMAHFTHGMALMMFVLFAISLIRSKEKNRLHRFLLWEVFFWVFVELKDVVYLIDGMWENETVFLTNLCIDMWCVPFTFAILFEILSPKWMNFKHIALISSPFLLLSVITVVVADLFLFKVLIIIALCFGLVAAIVVVRAARKYDKYLKDNYSNLERISVHWLMWFIILLMIVLIAWALVNWRFSWWGDAVFYLFISVCWIVFYFKTQEQTFVEIPDLLMPFSFGSKGEDKIMTVSLSKDNAVCANQKNIDLASKLNKQMNVNHIYLQPDLSINTLAMALATNRTYLSDYLNGTLKTTFYDYVNAFRVEEACVLLLSQREKSLGEIAELCGFGSVSTFRRAFQKYKSMNPSEWRQKHKL